MIETTWKNAQQRRQKRIKSARVTGRGQAAVEFALVAIVLMALLYGIIEISRLILINAELENAAREGVHYLALHPDTSTAYLKTNIIAPHLTLIDPTDPGFTVSAGFPRGGVGQYLPAVVTTTYGYTSLVNIMPDMDHLTLRPLGPFTLEASGTKLIETR